MLVLLLFTLFNYNLGCSIFLSLWQLCELDSVKILSWHSIMVSPNAIHALHLSHFQFNPQSLSHSVTPSLVSQTMPPINQGQMRQCPPQALAPHSVRVPPSNWCFVLPATVGVEYCVDHLRLGSQVVTPGLITGPITLTVTVDGQ